MAGYWNGCGSISCPGGHVRNYVLAEARDLIDFAVLLPVLIFNTALAPAQYLMFRHNQAVRQLLRQIDKTLRIHDGFIVIIGHSWGGGLVLLDAWQAMQARHSWSSCSHKIIFITMGCPFLGDVDGTTQMFQVRALHDPIPRVHQRRMICMQEFEPDPPLTGLAAHDITYYVDILHNLAVRAICFWLVCMFLVSYGRV